MHDHRQEGDRLPFSLERGARLLRERPAVRAEWREALLDRVERETGANSSSRRRITVPVSWAIAAGLVCAIAGGAIARLAPASRTASSTAVSATSIALPVRFSVAAPRATTVSIVGDFNHWQPTALPLRRSANGRVWEVEVRLPLGRYSYAFLIDGKLAPDPMAPRASDDDFGSPNSVIMVSGS
jgi:hypothetical protein